LQKNYGGDAVSSFHEVSIKTFSYSKFYRNFDSNSFKSSTHAHPVNVHSNLFSECKGTLSTNLEGINPTPGKPHCHPPDNANIECTEARNAMRDQAQTTRDNPRAIIADQEREMTESAQSYLPSDESIARSLRYHRRGTNPDPPNLRDWVVPEDLRTIGNDRQPFLIFDNGHGESRTIAFATNAAMEIFAGANEVFIDGNFTMAPPQFQQLYVLRVAFGEGAVSCIYALMQRKTRDAYTELFQNIRRVCDDRQLQWTPNKAIMSDFEQASIQAAQDAFGPGIQQRCCFFHLTQSTWRKIQALDLVNAYNDEVCV
jgi:hypothetical protein